MTKREAENYSRWIDRMRDLGISLEDAEALRRIEMTLHRWYELECGNSDDYKSWAIERDENGEGPAFMVYHFHDRNKPQRERIPDREAGAKRRLAAIMEKYPDLLPYIQGDPRGGSLYVVPKSQLREGDKLDCVYTRGLYCNWK